MLHCNWQKSSHCGRGFSGPLFSFVEMWVALTSDMCSLHGEQKVAKKDAKQNAA